MSRGASPSVARHRAVTQESYHGTIVRKSRSHEKSPGLELSSVPSAAGALDKAMANSQDLVLLPAKEH